MEILKADTLGNVRHGFFTRKGGVSKGRYAALNCGAGSSDLSTAVAENRALVAEALELQPTNVVSVHQVHSADVVLVDGNQNPKDRPKADALVTRTPGVGLGVLTADCQPVLYSDSRAGVIGAAHAGWRGAKDGILEAVLDAMEAIGASRNNIVAAIGPCISQRAYEVGPEFFEEFATDNPESQQFFANGTGDRLLFDLPGYSLRRLRDAGVAAAEWTRHCTYTDPDRFFSYRRATHHSEPDYGRLISVIRL